MSAYVFLGPTLPVAEARQHLDAVYLPPVAQGDVQQVELERPSLIAIVDGYFERMPSVWHKEILWALDQGIPVLGASSMGALRAAELDAFGMQGVGRVFEHFRDGVLEDDDEVAVAHATAEHGYRPLSEAMVNIRRTLDDAVAAAVIGPATHELVLAAAKGTYYPHRSYAAALAEAGVDPQELERLRRYVASSAVDQKREDALALLALLRGRLERGETTVTTRFTFEYSEFWYEAQHTARSAPDRTADAAHPRISAADPGEVPAGPGAVAGGGDAMAAGPDEAGAGEELLDELRLDPDGYRHTWDAAYARLAAVEHARAAGREVSAEQLQAVADDVRRERGLHEPEAARAWLRDNDLSQEQVAALVREEAQLRWVRRVRDRAVAARLPDELRLAGGYPALVDRARDKARRLAEVGWEEVSLVDLDVGWDEVLDHYFRRQLGRDLPRDLRAFATAHGYLDDAHLRRVLLREYAYELTRRAAHPHAASDGADRPAV